MKKLRVAIIGTGGIANCHMGGYRALADTVEVVAGCDINEKKLNGFCDKYGITGRYTDFNEMLKAESPDLVSVCTWNSVHASAAIASLNAGANVLCEKPMAMNAAEAEEMLKTSEKTGKLLQVGFVRRFGKDADALKNYIKEGVFGDIYYAKATYLRRSGCPGGWFGDKSRSGGGPLIDLGVHVIDLVRYLGGLPKTVSVFGSTYNNLGPNRATGIDNSWVVGSDDKYTVEDFVTALVRFDNGLSLSVEASFNLNIEHDIGNIELFGTKAGCRISPELEIFTQMAGKFVNVRPLVDVPFGFNEAFNDEIKGFVMASLGKEPCRASAEDGLELMKIIDAVYESAETGRSVQIR